MGKNNVQLREEKNTVIRHWGLRKLSVGVASVLLGTTAYLGISNGAVVHADTVTASNNDENVATSNNGTLSQNLYQSDRIQTSKTAVNTNSIGNTQTTSQDVTSSKNDNHLIAANDSNKQVDEQQNYQQAEQSVSTEKQLNSYLVLAAQDNNDSSGSAELNDNNSWGSTIHYTYGTDAQLTEHQKKVGYVADSSKAGQAVYPDSQIKVGFDSQQNQMKVTVDGQKVSFTQTDKGYKTGTSDVATDYDNLKGHVYRLFDITFTLPLNSSDGNYHGTYNTYTLQCSSDMTNGKLVFKTQDTALNDYFYQQKLTTEFKYVDYSNDKTVYQTVPGPDVLSNGQTVTYQYQAPNGYDLLLSSKTLTMTLNSNSFLYSGYWKLDSSSTPAHYVFLVPVTKSYTPPKADESFGQLTGGVVTEDGKPFDFNSGWWGQTRYELDFSSHSFKEVSKTENLDSFHTRISLLVHELDIMHANHINSVYDYMNSGQAAKDFSYPHDDLDTYLQIDNTGRWLTNPKYVEPNSPGSSFAGGASIDPLFENFIGANTVWVDPSVGDLWDDADEISALWKAKNDDWKLSFGTAALSIAIPKYILTNGAVNGVLKYKGIQVTQKDKKTGKILSVDSMSYLSFLTKYTYQYLLDNMAKGISYDFSLVVKPCPFTVQKKNYTVHFKYANGPKAGQSFRNDWHGYIYVIMCDGQPVAYSTNNTVQGAFDIHPEGPSLPEAYNTASGFYSNPKAFLQSDEAGLINYSFVNKTDKTYSGSSDWFEGYQSGVVGMDGAKLASLVGSNYKIDENTLLFSNKDQPFYNTPRFNWDTITRDQAIQMANSYETYTQSKQKKNTSLDYSLTAENVDPTPAELTVNALYTEPTTKVTLNYVDATSNKVLSTSTLNLNTNVVTVADLAMPENYVLVSKPASQNNVNLVYGADGNLNTVSLAQVSSTPIVINLKVKPLIAHITYQFYDVDGNLIQSANVNGKYGQTVDVHSVIPAGWQLYAGQIVPDVVKLGTYNPDLAFVLDHKIAEIKPEMNVSTTTVIPGTNHLTYPIEALSSNLNRDLVYTVKVKDPDGKAESKVFKQHVSRSAYLDLVTGKVIGYSKWTNNGQHTFNAFVAQPKDGYTINTLPAVTLDVDHPTKIVNVSYVPKTINGQIVYKTFDGQTVDTQAFTGTSAVNLTAPTGYRLSTEVTSLHPANENGQTYIVYVVPQVTTYTSSSTDKPANVGDLFKTVTRTINIKLVNGRTRTIKQLVRFERTARVDANGKVIYSNWQSIGRNKFNAVYVPKRVGYHAVIRQDGKVLPKVDQVVDISADANDSVIHIEYVKN